MLWGDGQQLLGDLTVLQPALNTFTKVRKVQRQATMQVWNPFPLVMSSLEKRPLAARVPILLQGHLAKAHILRTILLSSRRTVSISPQALLVLSTPGQDSAAAHQLLMAQQAWW